MLKTCTYFCLAEVQELSDLLEVERSKSEALDAQVLRLQAQVNSRVGRVERAEAKEKELAERHKEKVRKPLVIFLSEWNSGSNIGTRAANY